YLLKLLIEKPNVLLLDEPTNDLDIATLKVLENFLANFAGPVITVSHDRYFLDKVATKILAFEEGDIRVFYGNYSDYLDEKVFEKETVEADLAKTTVTEEVPLPQKEERKRMSYLEKQEWAQIEDKIATIEANIEEIENQMLTVVSDYGQLAQLQKELDQRNNDLLLAYERFEYLSGLDI
ncbi:TPA: ABC transporter ATP-binding protein, partial [Streptococcus pyogenes]